MNVMQQKRPFLSKKTATKRVKHRLLQIKNAASQKNFGHRRRDSAGQNNNKKLVIDLIYN
ncbi:hypothetical protein [Aeromonas jandaei]|uniref:hypothetical protein n=1 Tax=Aeromonas jandaei TaxID=650 RepID=UPI00398784B1